MRYRYSPPVVERHVVEWDAGRHPGIYDPAPRTGFASLVLAPELAAWLDTHAPSWSFRSDWDYSNAGDDDERCHLTLNSREQGEGFVAKATGMSEAWIAADRQRMPLRVALVIGDETPVEIARGHAPYDITNAVERAVQSRGVSNDHSTGTRAGRDARVALTEMTTRQETRREVALTPATALGIPARLVVEIVAVNPTGDGEKQGDDRLSNLITDEQREALLKNGRRTAAGEDLDPVPVVRLRAPDGPQQWLLTELADDGDTAYGLCDLGIGLPECGEVSLAWIAEQRGAGTEYKTRPSALEQRTVFTHMAIERDPHFPTPGTPRLSLLDRAAHAAGRVII